MDGAGRSALQEELTALARGDRSAFDPLFRRTWPLVRGVRYPVVFGAGAAKAYGGAPALPLSVFIDRRGRIVSTLVGVDGRERLEREALRLFR